MIRPSKTLAAVLPIAVGLIALAGCSHAGGSPKSNSLDGTRWKLTEWAPSSPSRADSTITVSPVRLSPVRFTITAGLRQRPDLGHERRQHLQRLLTRSAPATPSR